MGIGKNLNGLKKAKITELREACRAHIFAGFDSDALGTVHHYPAKQGNNNFDQTNLMAQYSDALNNPSETYYIMCADANGVWARRPHTASQTITVGRVGLKHVADARDKLLGTDATDGLADQANKATTETEIEAVTW